MEMEAERKGRKTKDFDTVYQCRACQHSSEDGALDTFHRVPLALPANTFLAQGQLEGYGHDEAILFRCKACPEFVVVDDPDTHWEDVHQRGRRRFHFPELGTRTARTVGDSRTPPRTFQRGFSSCTSASKLPRRSLSPRLSLSLTRAGIHAEGKGFV